MKRLSMLLIILSIIAGVAFGQSSSGGDAGMVWNILSYIDAYVAASSDVENQLEKIEGLEAALETAQIRRDSQLSIEKKMLDLEVARLAVRELENTVASSAVNLYVAFVAANRDFASSQKALATAKEEFGITSNRYEAEEESERTLLNAELSLLQSEKSYANAENKLRQSKNSLVRALDLSEDDTFVADELPQLNIDDVVIELDPERIIAASSNYYETYQTVLLKEKELKAKSGSSVFTESEIDALQTELDLATEKYKTASWNLEDDIVNLQNEFKTLKADIEIALINMQISETDLASTELQFEFGEVLRTDRDSARQKVFSSLSTQKSLNENLLKTILSVVKLNGGSVRSELGSLLSNN
jgi:hypothetical protein